MCFQILQIAKVIIGPHGIRFRQVNRVLNNEIGIIGVGMISNEKTRRINSTQEVCKIDMFCILGASGKEIFCRMGNGIKGGPG